MGKLKTSLQVLAASVLLGGGVVTPVLATAAEDADYSIPSSAEAMALAAELSELKFDGSEIGVFYASRGYEPLWFGDRTLMRAMLVEMYRSHDHGLPSESYGAEELADLVIRSDTPKSRALAEIAMSDAFLRFARHLNSGVLTPNEVDKEIHTVADVKSADILLGMIGSAEDAGAIVDALAPTHSDYGRLLEEKANLEKEIAEGNFGEAIPANRLIRPGDTGREIELVRARLNALGYAVELSGTVYDDALLEVVKTFQADHLLSQDGVLGPATIGRMNLSPAGRLEQILVNLERLRWLNIERGERHIMVNIPDYSMAVMDNGVATFTSKVVVGANTWDRRTPEFSHEMSHMVINPFWHVPRSIARREFLPMLQEDSAALANRGMILLNRNGQQVPTIGRDFTGYDENNFPFFVKQPPGPANALGRVKFMFPNRHNIYLHDTPAKKLFGRQNRAYSHGCIRVARPFDFAYHLLAPQSTDPEAVFQRHLSTGKERQVNLERKVPIHLVYRTAFEGPDGAVIYRNDIYDRDEKVYDALIDAGVGVPALQG